MSAFDDLLGEYEPPSAVDIVLPAKIGGNDKGGAAASTSVAGSTPAGRPSDQSQSATGPEPEPQLPEGSDPDEPDAVEDEVDDDAARADPEPDGEPAPVSEDAGPLDGEGSGEDAQNGPVEVAEDVSPHPVIPRKGSSLSFEGPSVNLKFFPRALVEEMREMLKPHLGDDFARDISQFSLVTAFVIAAMGADIQTDEFTAHAVRAFRANDPRVDAIDQRTAAIQDQQAVIEKMMKRALAKLGDLEDTATVLEIGQAYSMAERTAQLDTMGVLPETIDVTQKRVLATKDNIRRKVEVEIRDQRIRAGRPIR